MFMELAMCAAMPVGGHTREFALQVLGECGGDIRAATLRLMTRPHAPAPYELRWAPEEVETFLAGLRHYDKDFYRIAQLVSCFAVGIEALPDVTPAPYELRWAPEAVEKM